MPIEFIFAYTSMGSVLLPLGISAFQLYRLKGSSLYLSYLLSASLLSDVSSYFLGKSSGNSYLIANVYLLYQFLTLSKIYFHELGQPRYLKFIAIVFTLFFFINAVFVQGLFVFNTHSNSLSGLVLVSISLYYLFNLLKNLPDDDIYQLPMLWISFGVLFYCGGTLILFLTNNFLVDKFPGSHRLVWILHNFCNIVKNVLFTIALWHNYRNLKHSS
jgi:hypothetical protein